MEFRIFILSLACFSCLVAPTLGSIHALKAAAALGALAVKGAAIKGAVEGAAAKGAALLAAKKAAVKEALASLVAHKLPAAKPPVIIQEPAIVVPAIVPANSVSIKTSPPRLPPVSNSLSSLLSSAQQAVQLKINSLSGALAQRQPRPAVVAAPIVVESLRYPYPYPARVYPAPLPVLHTIDDDCFY